MEFSFIADCSNYYPSSSFLPPYPSFPASTSRPPSSLLLSPNSFFSSSPSSLLSPSDRPLLLPSTEEQENLHDAYFAHSSASSILPSSSLLSTSPNSHLHHSSSLLHSSILQEPEAAQRPNPGIKLEEDQDDEDESLEEESDKDKDRKPEGTEAGVKPPYSYVAMIAMAINESGDYMV